MRWLAPAALAVLLWACGSAEAPLADPPVPNPAPGPSRIAGPLPPARPPPPPPAPPDPPPETAPEAPPPETAPEVDDPYAARRAALEALHATARHRPALLDQSARPCRIKPGKYACRISEGYKLRDCVVERLASGHVMLEVGPGNLIGLRGVLYDDGPVVRFEGWPTDDRPFQCYTCQDRCYLDPGSCGCTPGPLARTASCLAQPVHGVFKGGGRTWRGVVIWRDYYDPAVHDGLPPRTLVSEKGLDRFEVLLKRR
jgi:hypothetical protein